MWESTYNSCESYMIKLHKQIILDPKLDLLHNHYKMKGITSCITSKNFAEFFDHAPHLFYVIDEVHTKSLPDGDLTSEYLV